MIKLMESTKANLQDKKHAKARTDFVLERMIVVKVPSGVVTASTRLPGVIVCVCLLCFVMVFVCLLLLCLFLWLVGWLVGVFRCCCFLPLRTISKLSTSLM